MEKQTIQATFVGLDLGGVDDFTSSMEARFPQLGLVKEDCIEMSWIQTFLYYGQYPMDRPEILLNRTAISKISFKVKSDYVKKPIPKFAFEGMWQRLLYEEEGRNAIIYLIPYGGRMDEIPENEIQFPHRAGDMYKILYGVGDGAEDNDSISDKSNQFLLQEAKS